MLGGHGVLSKVIEVCLGLGQITVVHKKAWVCLKLKLLHHGASEI